MVRLGLHKAPQAPMRTVRYGRYKGGRALRLDQANGSRALARTDFGSFCLGNFTFKKLQLGKLLRGKCLPDST